MSVKCVIEITKGISNSSFGLCNEVFFIIQYYFGDWMNRMTAVRIFLAS